MKIFVSLLDDKANGVSTSNTDGHEFIEMDINEDDGLEVLLSKASTLLGTEVVQAMETTYRAIISDTEDIMPGDKLLFKPPKAAEADIVLSIPGAKCFDIEDGKTRLKCEGELSLLLVHANQSIPTLILSVGTEFHYSLNAVSPGTKSVEGDSNDSKNSGKKTFEGKSGSNDSNEGTSGSTPTMLPVVIHAKRHLVIPGREQGTFYGIALPADTSEGLLIALREILESHALLNTGEPSETSESVRDLDRKIDTKVDNEVAAKDLEANGDHFVAKLKAQAVAFLLSAREVGGGVQESNLYKSIVQAGQNVGSTAATLAKGVSSGISTRVSSLKSHIEKRKSAEKDGTYVSAVAKAITENASVAAGEAGESAKRISRGVSDNLHKVVEQSRDEDGNLSPKDIAFALGKQGVDLVKEGASKAGEITRKSFAMVQTNIGELKLRERLSHAQTMGQKGIKTLTNAVETLLARGDKEIDAEEGEEDSGRSKALMARVRQLSEQLAIIKRAQALGTWSSEKMTHSVVAVKKATAEVRKLVRDKHIQSALKSGVQTLQSGLTETVAAIEAAGRGKESRGERLEAYIETSADITVQSIQASVEILAMGIRVGKSILKKQIGHSQRDVKISPQFRSAVTQAQQYSVGAAVISEALVTELVGNAGEITNRIAGDMAKAASSVMKTPSSQSPPSESTKLEMLRRIQGPIGDAAKSAEKVIGKAAVSWAHVILAMKNAGIALVQEFGDATAEVAEHSFGSEVGDIVGRGVNTYTNVTKTMTNISSVRDVKGIAKCQAKSALKSAAKAYNEERKNMASPEAIEAGGSSEVLEGDAADVATDDTGGGGTSGKDAESKQPK
eukprot:CAMPEP_0184488996 /NCGR_PEP_ID=MMETSP0113_2-20130426/14045_1 /TAXON_ID=91329 /ORGANISM="Norrisiella sphaerica, Strain BC52" /LENGTH=844 /DNA_ID=CAMNT_0026872149 /DNA_START=211 /DNA_END=2745 /DNA_ORIENTATION=+